MIALDVLRALARTPEAADAFIAELERGIGHDPRLDHAIDDARAALDETGHEEVGARRLVEQLATTWTATLLVRHGDHHVADTYVRSRLDHDWGSEFGTLPVDAPLRYIAERAIPVTGADHRD